MSIVSYEYKDTLQQGESFSKIDLGKVNLFVGASGSGKTRFLNTLFNFGSFLTTGERFRRGHWKIELQASSYTYFLEYIGQGPGETEREDELVESDADQDRAGQQAQAAPPGLRDPPARVGGAGPGSAQWPDGATTTT